MLEISKGWPSNSNIKLCRMTLRVKCQRKAGKQHLETLVAYKLYISITVLSTVVIPSINFNYDINALQIKHIYLILMYKILLTFKLMMCSHTISHYYASKHLRTTRCSSVSVKWLHFGLAVQVVGERNASWEGDPRCWQRKEMGEQMRFTHVKPNSTFCMCVCVLTALGQKRVVLWSGCVPCGMNSGCLLSPSLSWYTAWVLVEGYDGCSQPVSMTCTLAQHVFTGQPSRSASATKLFDMFMFPSATKLHVWYAHQSWTGGGGTFCLQPWRKNMG